MRIDWFLVFKMVSVDSEHQCSRQFIAGFDSRNTTRLHLPCFKYLILVETRGVRRLSSSPPECLETRAMDIKYSIRVHKNNLETLKTLKCLQSVSVSEDGKAVTCQFKDNKTRGSLIARTGDWIVEYATGEYQRFGNEAYQRLCWNPSRTSKEY